MKVKAAICWEPRPPLEIDEIDLDGPKAGECLVRLVATGVCHTDAYTMSGRDPSGLFPAVLGHEGAGVVEEVGPGVDVARGRRPRDPALHPRVPQLQVLPVAARPTCAARSCATQGKGLMPDGTSRLSHHGPHAAPLHGHVDLRRVHGGAGDRARQDPHATRRSTKVCLLGCGITTGIGAVLNTAKVRAGRDRRRLRPRRHRAVGGPGRGDGRRRAHHRHRHQPEEVRAGARSSAPPTASNPHDAADVAAAIVEMTDGGVDFSFECIGNVEVMGQALACTHKGWGQAIIIGVAGAGEEIHARPFLLVTGRSWRGTAFGGTRGRTQLPRLRRLVHERPHQARRVGHRTPCRSTTSTTPST